MRLTWEALKIVIGDNTTNVWDHDIEPLIGVYSGFSYLLMM